MKHKTDELTGALLDAAVAKAQGLPLSVDWNQGEYILVGTGQGDLRRFSPSTAWSDGGPIIERERISVMRERTDDEWSATVKFFFEGGIDGPAGFGPTALVAAMRAFVRAKLGDEVELP